MEVRFGGLRNNTAHIVMLFSLFESVDGPQIFFWLAKKRCASNAKNGCREVLTATKTQKLTDDLVAYYGLFKLDSVCVQLKTNVCFKPSLSKEL